MGTVSSIFQAALFAIFSSAILAYSSTKLANDFHLSGKLVPRLVVYQFCVSFVLGLVFLESTSVDLHPDYGPIIGPMGTFLAALACLFFTQVVVMFTWEFALLAPVAFAAAYTYGRAKAANFQSTQYGPVFASAVILFGLVVLLVDNEYIDEFADTITDFFDLESSEMPDTYLMEQGGLFHIPLFAPIFIALACYGLMWAQVPQVRSLVG